MMIILVDGPYAGDARETPTDYSPDLVGIKHNGFEHVYKRGVSDRNFSTYMYVGIKDVPNTLNRIVPLEDE